MELQIQTSKTFEDINSDRKIVLLRGGSRSGKSYSAVQYLIVKAIEEAGTVISIVRKSFPSLRISTLRDFRTIMEELHLWEEERYLATEKAYRFDNGSMIEFLSIDDAEKRKGTKRDYLFIDEANELNYEDFFQLFIRTTFKTILAYNPSFSKQHWIYKQVAIHPQAEEYISTYRDNPFLDQRIADEIDRLKDISPSYYAVYGNAEFGMVEGVIFDNVSVIDDIPEGAKLLGYGFDAGYSNDPSAIVGMYQYESDIIYDEIVYQKGLLTNQLANHLLTAYEHFGRNEVWIDSSEPRLRDEIFRYGINIKSVVKGKDSIVNGIDVMKQHRILLTKRSSNLINEFFSYSWKKDKNGGTTNEPEDINNHGIDACRYVAMMRISKAGKNKGTYNISIR
jgi:phage terminase large subunit